MNIINWMTNISVHIPVCTRSVLSQLDTSKVKKVLIKSLGMTLAKVKEQDGMMLAKLKEQLQDGIILLQM